MSKPPKGKRELVRRQGVEALMWADRLGASSGPLEAVTE